MPDYVQTAVEAGVAIMALLVSGSTLVFVALAVTENLGRIDKDSASSRQRGSPCPPSL